MSAGGGKLEEASVDDVAPQTDPSWSPDGRSLAWGRPPKELDPFVPAPTTIQVLDLKTRQVWTLPGSQARFHPAWSPDGRYIAAYHEDWHIVLFDIATQKWTELTDFPVFYHQWSKDGKQLYFGRPPGIYRMRITDRKIEQVPSLTASQRIFGWFGLAPDDAPVVLRDVGNQEIYALDVEFPQ